MVNLDNVDYVQMPTQAKLIRDKGRELNRKVKLVYQKVADMHADWYGQRYASLIEQFNKLSPSLNEMLKLVYTEIPFVLESIANNYAKADTGSGVCSPAETPINAITNIPTHKEDVGMRFITVRVEETKNIVRSNFDSAKALLDEIQVIYKNIKWESDAATKFGTAFAKLKNNIDSQIEEINASFVKLMNQTEADMQTTENANTVN